MAYRALEWLYLLVIHGIFQKMPFQLRYTIEKNDDLIGGVTFDTLSVALRSGSIHRQKCLSSGIYNISTVG